LAAGCAAIVAEAGVALKLARGAGARGAISGCVEGETLTISCTGTARDSGLAGPLGAVSLR